MIHAKSILKCLHKLLEINLSIFIFIKIIKLY